MFLCSLVKELNTKEENDKTVCNFNFGHECNMLINAYVLFLVFCITNTNFVGFFRTKKNCSRVIMKTEFTNLHFSIKKTLFLSIKFSRIRALCLVQFYVTNPKIRMTCNVQRYASKVYN